MCYSFFSCIAGLSYSTDDISLREAFAGYGEIIEGTPHVFVSFMLIIANVLYLLYMSYQTEHWMLLTYVQDVLSH